MRALSWVCLVWLVSGAGCGDDGGGGDAGPVDASLPDAADGSLDASTDTGVDGGEPVVCDPAPVLEVTRLNGGMPIITQSMFVDAGAPETDGEDINFPTVIRVPDWVPADQRADPSAVYYLYFAHHLGEYIRLAWATDPIGPWHLYGAGASAGSRGVLDLGPGLAITLDNGIVIDRSVGAPEIVVDEAGHRVIMYFRAEPVVDGFRPITVETFAAVSDSGLDFTAGIQPVMLGRGYFRVFEHGGNLYALANRADPYRALDATDPWAPPPGFMFTDELWERRADNPWSPTSLRHVGLRLRGDVLDLFYTRIGDAPERILYTTIDLSGGDFTAWAPGDEVCVLKPELPWEGGDVTPERSIGGPAPEDVAQLRDPYLFTDTDGETYLFYVGRGEDAIGVASVHFL